MPIVTVQDPTTGRPTQVEIPEGATPRDAQQYLLYLANKRRREEQRRREIEVLFSQPEGVVDRSIVGNIGAGLAAGAVNTFEAAVKGAGTAFDEETEQAIFDTTTKIADYLRPEREEGSYAYDIASGIGSMAAFAPTALLGPLALPAAAGLGSLAGIGEQRGRIEAARKEGKEVTPEQKETALQQAAMAGTLEAVPFTRILGPLNRLLRGKVPEEAREKVLDTFKKRVGSAAKTGSMEAVQEETSNVLQNVIEMGYNPDATELQQFGDQALAAGASGAIIQTIIDGLVRGRQRRAAAQADEAETETLPQPEAEPRDPLEQEIARREQVAREKAGDLFPTELREAQKQAGIASIGPQRPAREVDEELIDNRDRQADMVETLRAEDKERLTRQSEGDLFSTELREAQEQADVASIGPQRPTREADEELIDNLYQQLELDREALTRQPEQEDFLARERELALGKDPKFIPQPEPPRRERDDELVDNRAQQLDLVREAQARQEPEQRDFLARERELALGKDPKFIPQPEQPTQERREEPTDNRDQQPDMFETARAREAEERRVAEQTSLDESVRNIVEENERSRQGAAPLESLIPERTAPEPEQLRLPGVQPKKSAKRAAPAPQPETTAEPVVEDNVQDQMQMFGPRGGVQPDAAWETTAKRLRALAKESQKETAARRKVEDKRTKEAEKSRETSRLQVIEEALKDTDVKDVKTAVKRVEATAQKKGFQKGAFENNLSPNEIMRIDKLVTQNTKAKPKPQTKPKPEPKPEPKAKETPKVKPAAKKQTKDLPPLKSDARIEMRSVPNAAVKKLLQNGQAESALRLIAENMQSPRMKQIAERLADNIGSTKVVFDGALSKDIAGQFDPKTNTITLNPNVELSAHTVLHESTHATVSATLDNPAHPLTKKLGSIFNAVKPNIPNFYASQNLQEFVAEAMSNPAFRSAMAQMRYEGSTVYERVFSTIKDFVKKLLRLPKSPDKSVLSEVEALVDEIIAPAPDARASGDLLNLMMNSATGDPLGGIVNSLEKVSPTASKKIRDALTNADIPVRFRRAASYFMSAYQVAKAAENLLPEAAVLTKMMREFTGSLDVDMSRAAVTIKRAMKLSDTIRKRPEGFTKLNDVMYSASYHRIDPSKPRSYYENINHNKRELSEAETLEFYDQLRSAYNKLSDAEKELYNLIKANYRKSFDSLLSVIEQRLDNLGVNFKDKALLARLKDQVSSIEPYFPFTRKGSYFVEYEIKGMGRFVESFENKTDRRDAIEALRKTGKLERLVEFENVKSFADQTPKDGSMVFDLIQTLEKTLKNSDQKQEVIDQIVKSYMNALPERSYLRALQPRKGVLGFDTVTNPAEIFASRLPVFTRNIAQLKFAAKVAPVEREIRKKMENRHEAVTFNEAEREAVRTYGERMLSMTKFTKAPAIAPWANIATGLGFSMTLGANISGAMINFAQVFISMPYMGAAYGYDKTFKAMAEATKLIGASGREREVDIVSGDGTTIKEKVRPLLGYGIDNYGKDAPKWLKPLIDRAKKEGQLYRNAMLDSLDAEGISNPAGAWAKFNTMSGFLHHHSERFNRQVTMITAYRLEYDKLRSEGKSEAEAGDLAARKAIDTTDFVNGSSTAGATPKVAQNNVGKVVMMYKNYSLAMLYFLTKLSRDAIGKTAANPEERKLAQRQLGAVLTSLVATTGLAGLPLFSELMTLLDLFSDDDEETINERLRLEVGEGMYKGLLNEMFGVELSSRVGLSGLVFRDFTMGKDQGWLQELAVMFGGPVFGSANSVMRGVDLVMEGELRRGAEAMSPAALRNMLKAERFYSEGALTMRGDPIVDSMGAGHLFGQFIGFAPAEYIRNIEKGAMIKRIGSAKKETKTKLLKRLNIARRFNDAEEMRKVREEIAEFNKKNPQIRIKESTIKRSMVAFDKRSLNAINGIIPSSELVKDAQELDALWDEAE